MLACCLLCLPVRAYGEESGLEESLGADELEALTEDAGLDGYGDLHSEFRAGDALRDLLGTALQAAVKTAAPERMGAILLVVLLCGLVRNTFCVENAGLDVLTFAGAAAISLLTLNGDEALTTLSLSTLVKAQDAANVLLPVLSGAALISGQVTAAAAKYSAASLFLNILMNLCVNGVVPLIRFYAAAAAAEAAGGSEVLSGVLGFLKWCVTMALTGIVLSFTLYLSLCGLISGTADAAVLRGVKTAISTMLPVVGSIASDAAGALLASAAALRQTAGLMGLVLLASILLLPFLRVGLQFLLFRGAAAVSAGLADGRMKKLLGRFGETMGMLLGCLGACGLMLYFSVFSLMGVTLG